MAEHDDFRRFVFYPSLLDLHIHLIQTSSRSLSSCGMLKTVTIAPADPKRAKTRSFPLGYVEDVFKPRTQLATVFSISLHAMHAGVPYIFMQLHLKPHGKLIS